MNITRVTSSAAGLLSNTYLVEAPEGTVVVDPPMLVSDARVVREAVDVSGAQIAAVIYTHPHPDHVNGATEILAGAEVPVFATAGTDRVSREIDGPKREYWTPIYGDDYPPITTFATVHVDADPEAPVDVEVAGLSFSVHDMGPGECETAALWITGRHAFVGDVVYSHAHPWLFEARSSLWLTQLELARPLLEGRTLWVGHGEPGDQSLVDLQVEYLRTYQSAIRELSGGAATLDDEAIAALTERMRAHWPGAPLHELVAMSANPVAAELAGPGQS